MSDTKDPAKKTAGYKVLMVDDEAHNLRAYERILRPLHYDLRRAENGTEALERVAADPPDIILLDVMMPGPSGFEVCRRLKSQPETQFIPVVLITGLTEREARIKGIEAGADEFVNKPVEPTELRVRVKSLLRTKALHDELQQRYEELRRLEAMREGLTQMIVHDLRGSLSEIVGYLQLLEMEQYISSEKAAQDYFQGLNASAQTSMDMTTSMLDLAKMEAGEMQLDLEEVGLEELIAEVEVGMNALLQQDGLKLEIERAGDLPLLQVDREILRRILVNIIGNAAKFSPAAGCITVAAQAQGGSVRVSVEDEGPGIPAAFRERIFDKFGQVENRQSGAKYSTGLGLAFCKTAVEAHGGEIGVDSEEGQGSRFWFKLPVARSAR